MARRPEIDLSRCKLCGACEELCPDVFRLNPAGYYEVLPRETYIEDCVDEAIADCPVRCIYWLE